MFNPKHLFLSTILSIVLLPACQKKGELIQEFNSLTEDSMEIFFDYAVYHTNPKVEVTKFGFYMGTTNDPVNDGDLFLHGNGGTESFTGSIPNLERNTTYSFVLYARADEKDYYGGWASIETSGTWEPIYSVPSGDFRTVAVSPNGNIHVAGLDGVHYYSSDKWKHLDSSITHK